MTAPDATEAAIKIIASKKNLRLLLTGALAATTVAVTVLSSVPLHTRLAGGYDDAVARRLVATNWLRTAAWNAGAACALVLAARGTT